MAALSVTEIYDQHIRPLTDEQRLQLLALIAQELANRSTTLAPPRRRSILELEGLGKEIWTGIDAQEYVDKLRAEWDERTQ
jgi:hypothetical protein